MERADWEVEVGIGSEVAVLSKGICGLGSTSSDKPLPEQLIVRAIMTEIKRGTRGFYGADSAARTRSYGVCQMAGESLCG